MARVYAYEKSNRDRSITGVSFNFGLCESQVNLISDQLDAIETVADNVEHSFLDPTPYLTTDVIEVDDIQDTLDAKNKMLKTLGKQVACTATEAYQPR